MDSAPITTPFRGVCLNEGGRFATFGALTWLEGGHRFFLVRLWILGREFSLRLAVSVRVGRRFPPAEERARG